MCDKVKEIKADWTRKEVIYNLAYAAAVGAIKIIVSGYKASLRTQVQELVNFRAFAGAEMIDKKGWKAYLIVNKAIKVARGIVEVDGQRIAKEMK